MQIKLLITENSVSARRLFAFRNVKDFSLRFSLTGMYAVPVTDIFNTVMLSPIP